jgi:DNA-binding transcriptional LysR family regulator
MFHDDLLVRTAAGFEPTLQGQRLIEELEVMLPRLDRLLSGSALDPKVEQARFRIAATEHAASIVAPALCREVLPSAKKVFFEFVALRNSGFEDLTRGGLDLVLSPDDTYPPSQLQGEVIYEEGVGLRGRSEKRLYAAVDDQRISRGRARRHQWRGRLAVHSGKAPRRERPQTSGSHRSTSFCRRHSVRRRNNSHCDGTEASRCSRATQSSD